MLIDDESITVTFLDSEKNINWEVRKPHEINKKKELIKRNNVKVIQEYNSNKINIDNKLAQQRPKKSPKIKNDFFNKISHINFFIEINEKKKENYDTYHHRENFLSNLNALKLIIKDNYNSYNKTELRKLLIKIDKIIKKLGGDPNSICVISDKNTNTINTNIKPSSKKSKRIIEIKQSLVIIEKKIKSNKMDYEQIRINKELLKCFMDEFKNHREHFSEKDNIPNIRKQIFIYLEKLNEQENLTPVKTTKHTELPRSKRMEEISAYLAMLKKEIKSKKMTAQKIRENKKILVELLEEFKQHKEEFIKTDNIPSVERQINIYITKLVEQESNIMTEL